RGRNRIASRPDRDQRAQPAAALPCVLRLRAEDPGAHPPIPALRRTSPARPCDRSFRGGARSGLCRPGPSQPRGPGALRLLAASDPAPACRLAGRFLQDRPDAAWQRKPMTTYECKTISVSIDRDWRTVYEFTARAENLARWAFGLGSGLVKQGEE